MPSGLKRFHGQGHDHFITFSCYRRLPYLHNDTARRVPHISLLRWVFAGCQTRFMRQRRPQIEGARLQSCHKAPRRRRFLSAEGRREGVSRND
jgi:hypothetical protein